MELNLKTYLVGGAVRDKLLGRPVVEKDYVVVGATPEDLLSQGYKPVGKDFPVFLHPKTKEEYALARTERKTGAGHTGFECFSSPDVTLEDDLLRRDLTVNAIAENDNGNLIDPYHGQTDLKNRILNHVSPAFSEDPLRVLRVARFMAQLKEFNFQISEATKALMTELSSSKEIQALSGERVWRELYKALDCDGANLFFNVLKEVGFNIIPHPGSYLGCIKDLDPELKFAVLFHESLDKLTFNPPSKYSELADLIHKYKSTYELLIVKSMAPADVYALLKGLDVIRRPERFEKWLLVCKALFKNEKPSVLIAKYAAAYASVDAGAVASKAKTNDEDVKTAVAAARLEALKAVIPRPRGLG